MNNEKKKGHLSVTVDKQLIESLEYIKSELGLSKSVTTNLSLHAFLSMFRDAEGKPLGKGHAFMPIFGKKFPVSIDRIQAIKSDISEIKGDENE